jgi:hypothetical protein
MFELHVTDKPRLLDVVAPKILCDIDDFLAGTDRRFTHAFVRRWSLNADCDQATLR